MNTKASDGTRKLMEEWYPAGTSVCADCGRKNKAGEMFWDKRGFTIGKICPQCRDAEEKWAKEKQRALYASGEDTPEYTDEITCPWCGYEESDSWEAAENDDEYECPECGGLFAYERHVTVTYSSKRVSPQSGHIGQRKVVRERDGWNYDEIPLKGGGASVHQLSRPGTRTKP